MWLDLSVPFRFETGPGFPIRVRISVKGTGALIVVWVRSRMGFDMSAIRDSGSDFRLRFPASVSFRFRFGFKSGFDQAVAPVTVPVLIPHERCSFNVFSQSADSISVAPPPSVAELCPNVSGLHPLLQGTRQSTSSGVRSPLVSFPNIFHNA